MTVPSAKCVLAIVILTLNDLEPANLVVLVNFSQFHAGHILRVNYAEITLNRCCHMSDEH